jgi:hypothetical protein
MCNIFNYTIQYASKIIIPYIWNFSKQNITVNINININVLHNSSIHNAS